MFDRILSLFVVRKCGHCYPDNTFISCNRHIWHLGKHRSFGGVTWNKNNKVI